MISVDLIDRARLVPIESLCGELKLRRVGRELVGACPRCGGTDRFAVSIAEQIFNCRGCRAKGNVIAVAQHIYGVGFREAVEMLAGPARNGSHATHLEAPARKPKNRGDYERQQHRKAAWLWSQHRPIAGTIVDIYLRIFRGITCPLPPTLGFLAPNRPDQHPAMIAAFALPDEPEPGIVGEPRNVSSVHLTLLRADGTDKANIAKPKLIVGSPGKLPIVLAPPNDLLGLAVAEGIEDGLTAHQATGLGAWAAGSGGRMPALAEVIPDYIESVTIYAHADKTGQRGADGLAQAIPHIETFIEGLS